MRELFSTDGVHRRDRFELWHEVACRTIINHESSPEDRFDFQAKIAIDHLADICLVRFSNSAMHILHGARHVSRSTSDDLFLCRQIEGTLALEQEAREVLMSAGDIVLLDPLLPYAGKFSERSELLVFKLPRGALEARVGKTRSMVARALERGSAETRLASSFIAMLPTHTGGMGETAKQAIANQTLDLVALSLISAMQKATCKLSSAHTSVSIKVRTAIEARLQNPGLNVRLVADAAGVSVRYGNAVLAQEGTSIARLILERRLDRCRKALTEPCNAHRSVSEIAHGWGFSDMTHFGRSFRKAYGILPSDYRSSVLGERPASPRLNANVAD